MESISRNTADLGADERQTLEKLLGVELGDHQQIIIQVMEVNAEKPEPRSPVRTARDYAILADLPEREAEDLVEAVLQRSPSREFDN